MKHPTTEQIKMTIRIMLIVLALAILCFVSSFVTNLDIAWAIVCFIYGGCSIVLIEMLLTYYFGYDD